MNSSVSTKRRRYSKTVRILGTHGVPGNYGGFETAAENIALFLVRRGWRVIVYCQVHGSGPITYDSWCGIERVNVPIAKSGWLGTALFDWLTIAHASQFKEICLTFGYNTGIFNIRQRIAGIPNIINMDGIEWSRKRWGLTRQAILYINERFAALFGDVLIADHPEIYKYLLTRAPARKVTTITYGANPIETPPSGDLLKEFGLQPRGYLTLIARPIPENSILEIVKAYSSNRRGVDLVVFGDYDKADDPYLQAVRRAASPEVKFIGPVYGNAVAVLRYHALGYFHGHTVGGTNPSLVEALAAGNPVFAHDNPYNRWVAGDAAVHFWDETQLAGQIAELLGAPDRLEQMSRAALSRYKQEFTWDRVAGQYEAILAAYVDPTQIHSPRGEQ